MNKNEEVISEKGDSNLKRKRILVIVILIESVIAVAFLFFLLYLHSIYPVSVTFILNWNDLYATVKGLAWMVEMIFILLFFFLGIYSFVEAKHTKSEAQRDYYFAVCFFAIFLGVGEFINVFVSVLSVMKIEIVPAVIPHASKVENLWIATVSALGMIGLTYCIEKYVKNRENKSITKLITICTGIGGLAIILTYIPAITFSETYVFVSFLLIGFPLLALLIGGIYLLMVYAQLALKSSGEVRQAALRIFIGYIIAIGGIILHGIREDINIPFNWIVFLLITLIGIILLVRGHVRMFQAS